MSARETFQSHHSAIQYSKLRWPKYREIDFGLRGCLAELETVTDRPFLVRTKQDGTMADGVCTAYPLLDLTGILEVVSDIVIIEGTHQFRRFRPTLPEEGVAKLLEDLRNMMSARRSPFIIETTRAYISFWHDTVRLLNCEERHIRVYSAEAYHFIEYGEAA